MSVDEQRISESHLDLTVVESEDRTLDVRVIYRAVDEDGEAGDYISADTKTYPIAGALPVPMMTTFLRLETRINNALAADDEEADRELEKVMDEAHRRIVGLIVERTPTAFREVELELEGRTVKAKPGIELDVSQILVLLAWVAGDVSVADRVARALTAGRSGAATSEEVEAGTHRVAEEEGEPTAATPFPSRPR